MKRKREEEVREYVHLDELPQQVESSMDDLYAQEDERFSSQGFNFGLPDVAEVNIRQIIRQI